MKLASLRNGRRDGQLVIVSRDLTRYSDASYLVPTLQAALDDWQRIAPHLEALAESLEHGSVPDRRFHEHDALSPLPRAYQLVRAKAYTDHVELDRGAHGADGLTSDPTGPLLYQSRSDSFFAPRDPIQIADEAWDVDFGAEVAVIIDDVPMGVDLKAARAAIRLVMLANEISLHGLNAGELATGAGFFQSKPSSAFSPVAVTPDELGEAWREGKLNLPLHVDFNGQPFGRADAGLDMRFDFGALIVHAARTRSLSAGTIIGSGTVSNTSEGRPGKPIAAGGVGYACIAEMRMVETGSKRTPFMRVGDKVRIEMKDAAGHSIFGAIEQDVER